jgi:hypothetical protein
MKLVELPVDPPGWISCPFSQCYLLFPPIGSVLVRFSPFFLPSCFVGVFDSGAFTASGGISLEGSFGFDFYAKNRLFRAIPRFGWQTSLFLFRRLDAFRFIRLWLSRSSFSFRYFSMFFFGSFFFLGLLGLLGVSISVAVSSTFSFFLVTVFSVGSSESDRGSGEGSSEPG